MTLPWLISYKVNISLAIYTENFTLPEDFDIGSESKCLAINTANDCIVVGIFEYIIIYNLNTKEKTRKPLQNDTFVNGVCFSNKKKYLACVTDNYDSQLYVYDVKNLKGCYQNIKIGSKNDLTCVQFSLDDQWLAIGTTNGFVSLVEVNNWQQRKIPFEESECYAICFSPDSEFLFFGAYGTSQHPSKIYIYSILGNSIINTLSTSIKESIAGLHCEIRNGVYEVILADKSGKIRFYNFTKVTLLASVKHPGYNYYVNHFSLSFKHNILIAVARHKMGINNFLIFKDLVSGNIMYQVPLDSTARVIELHPKLSIAAIGGLKTSKKNDEFSKQFVEAMTYSRNMQQGILDSDHLQTRTGEIKLYDVKNRKFLEINLEKSVWETTALAFSKNGNYLAYGGNDGRVYIYEFFFKEEREIDFAKSTSFSPLKFTGEYIWALKFTPDNQRLAVGTDSKLHLFNPKNQTLVNSEVNSSILSIDFSANSQFLVINAEASRSSLYSFSLYEIKERTLKLAYTLGHKDEVRCVAFSPQNDFIVSAGKDGKVIFWRMPNSSELLDFEKSKLMISQELMLYQFDEYFTNCEYLQFDKGGCLVICGNGILTRWKVEYNPAEEEKICLMLLWSSDKPTFYAKDANYDGVVNISKNNKILLSQYKAKARQGIERLASSLPPFPMLSESMVLGTPVSMFFSREQQTLPFYEEQKSGLKGKGLDVKK